MNEQPTSTPLRLPSGTPKWVLILCCVVSGVVVPTFLAFSPQLSELVKVASEARKAQADNEKTALGTVLELVNTNTKQIYVLSEELESLQKEKKLLTQRVVELEKLQITSGQALKDCEIRLKTCR